MPRAFGFTRYGGTDAQDFLGLDRPSPGAGELVVAVRAAGVNPVDLKYREGFLVDYVPLDLPAVFGQEVAGVVEELGQDVDGSPSMTRSSAAWSRARGDIPNTHS